MKHNNVVPNGHFKKDWQKYVRTWFNQPARKKKRRVARERKAVQVFPRPTSGLLRPVVHSQTLRYNSKVRAGRGFTLEELKEAGVSRKLAPTIGIAVDHRRKNRCLESLQTNVQRLQTYKAKLLVFPRRGKKVRAGDSSAEELSSATQLRGAVLPIVKARPEIGLVAGDQEMRAASAYGKLRLERMNARLVGRRKKKALEAEKEEKK
eukprot:TRINITY_DN195_c0_g3_i1.p1 TRINITY_DN195_c0_g3~~TRINITY_DN195_c0_g3_i1.p1  ORF type:complete len:207 (+),score=27.44 TRINITY_DN195_c0_g3_i1:73-693(+)